MRLTWLLLLASVVATVGWGQQVPTATQPKEREEIASAPS
ncbi:hypothetical protein HRbin17_02752 [bacterium HR17]|uniref:Uncharacterized protein n=1 Tax=Candidatus Fervidibacter japonicus TaxID=2035412 RepID=A0A2H5XGA4_9BACT|nr:hypothetical protein HRbin17_02752 [bacterium HR17]